jgi:hypothetical protein
MVPAHKGNFTSVRLIKQNWRQRIGYIVIAR